MNWIEEAIKKTEEFFENASEEDIQQALEEAGYEHYKDVEGPNSLVLTGSEFEHKSFIRFVQETTGCSYEDAMRVLGRVVEITQSTYVQGYNQAVNQLKQESKQS